MLQAESLVTRSLPLCEMKFHIMSFQKRNQIHSKTYILALLVKERVLHILQLQAHLCIPNLEEIPHNQPVQSGIRDDHGFVCESCLLFFFLSPCLPIYHSWGSELLEVRLTRVIWAARLLHILMGIEHLCYPSFLSKQRNNQEYLYS